MAFDPIWERIHFTRIWGKYPKEDLVRWVAKHYYGSATRADVRFLDLGCGAGANSWFLANEGFTVTPLDGSISGVSRAGGGVVADATQLPFKDQVFDCIVDVACITHNNEHDARVILDEAARVLKPTGKIFSIMPTSGCSPTPYEGKGHVLFSSLNEVKSRFCKNFAVEVNRSWFSEGRNAIDHWLISGTKHAN